MYKIGDYSVSHATLNKFIERFVPDRSVYYFDDEQILRSLLERGLIVYAPKELLISFPTFSLDYGSIYNIWGLSLSDTSFVARLNADELSMLNLDCQARCWNSRLSVVVDTSMMSIGSMTLTRQIRTS